jgi:deazaflavin-dependent oxidoreductase (nitroreductase family)
MRWWAGMSSYLLAVAIVVGAVAVFATLPWTLPTSWYRTLFYPGGRPRTFTSRLNAAQAQLTALGILPALVVALETKGRRSGKTYLTQLVVAGVDGERYLVSMLGENVDWVRNVRASAGVAVLRHRRTEKVRLKEVPVSQRAPILKAYLQVAPGGRPHFDLSRDAPPAEFEKIAARYPVFRIVVE